MPNTEALAVTITHLTESQQRMADKLDDHIASANKVRASTEKKLTWLTFVVILQLVGVTLADIAVATKIIPL